jgi:hypothetical protein
MVEVWLIQSVLMVCGIYDIVIVVVVCTMNIIITSSLLLLDTTFLSLISFIYEFFGF